LTGIEDSLNGYCSSYEKIAKDICEGIDEGFNEGLRKGIKKGFVAGVKECRLTGFDNIEVKNMEEILKCAFDTASDETYSTAKQAISHKYLAKVAPSFKQKMEEACNKAVEEIKDADFELDKKSAFCTKSCVDASVKKITACIGNVCADMKKKFSTDVTFGSFFDRLQGVFNSELEKNLKTCEERICKEIDNKVNNKRLDHERH